MPHEPGLRSPTEYHDRAHVPTGAAHRDNAGYFTRHPGVACLTKAAAAFGVGYLIGTFGGHDDTRIVFRDRVIEDDDEDDDHGHGHHKHGGCKR
jgi:hypothetical protein